MSCVISPLSLFSREPWALWRRSRITWYHEDKPAGPALPAAEWVDPPWGQEHPQGLPDVLGLRMPAGIVDEIFQKESLSLKEDLIKLNLFRRIGLMSPCHDCNVGDYISCSLKDVYFLHLSFSCHHDLWARYGPAIKKKHSNSGQNYGRSCGWHVYLKSLRHCLELGLKKLSLFPSDEPPWMESMMIATFLTLGTT